ncbi:TPA: hypothetical protein TZI98_002075 [Streptococcus suis]|nr:hypothetical protein [Streptococcus suis]HEL2259325.1 hypothetical protein [Streptococcus suis]HEL2259333.1 hypothetical protein [Streptococcus suis]
MEKIEEFWYCVSPQENLPLYTNDNKVVTTENIEKLVEFITFFKSIQILDANSLKKILSNILIKDPDIISSIRTLVGVSNKRLYLDLTYIINYFSSKSNIPLVQESRKELKKHPTEFYINLLKKSEYNIVLSEIISQYFLDKGLLEIVQTFVKLEKNQITSIFNNLIATKEVQQKQAKYRGHGAEQEFAKIFKKCGVNISPENKDVNPMAERDPNVDLTSMKIVDRDANNDNVHSFDLVIYDSKGNLRILIQSLIHSSDPGQFGVNKSNESRDIKNLITEFNKSQTELEKRVYLMGSVDGVGFSENPNGTIKKMLNEFDSFFQMNTLFKIPVFLQKIGIIDNVQSIYLDEDYFNQEFIEYFNNEYLIDTGINLVSEKIPDHENCFPAGKGIVYLE